MRRVPSEPPEFLFFAVEASKIDKIYRHGLNRSKMASMALYDNTIDARKMVDRKKQACMFAILARVMVEDGFTFYRTDQNEWFTDEIPPKYLRFQ